MKIEIREIAPAPPPKEYVLTLNEDEIKYIKYLAGDSTRLAAGRLYSKIPVDYYGFNPDNCFKDK